MPVRLGNEIQEVLWYGGVMGANSKTKVAANRAKIIEGTNEGKTQREIGEELGLTRDTVNRNLAALKASFVQGNREDFEKYVRAQLDLLTKAIEEVWEGNLPPDAANSIRGMMDSIARLTGSNAPSKSIVARVDGESSPMFLMFRRVHPGLDRGADAGRLRLRQRTRAGAQESRNGRVLLPAEEADGRRRMSSLWDYYVEKRPRLYTSTWHLRQMAHVLERAVTERRNAIIEAPPRHSKSEMSEVYMPGWRLSEDFTESIMCVTNSDSLSRKFSQACRQLVNLPIGDDRGHEWRIKGTESLNYSYKSSGVKGQLTGHGASILCLDDLVKNGQEAKSEVVRDSLWDGVVSSAINRLSPDGICIALQSRLHQDDPLGRLLELEHMNWLHLHLPAINVGGKAFFRDGGQDPLYFDEYEALWPDRYDARKLQEIRDTVTPYYWNAQYMCEPSMGDLAYFDMEKCPAYQHPTCERVWIAADCANTATATGSYTAYVCLGLSGSQLKVLGAIRGRWKHDQMAEELLAFYGQMARLTGIAPEAVILERAAGGYALIDRLSSKLPVAPVYPQGSKEERAGSVAYVVNRGQLALPASATWLQAWKEEMANFPLGANNDFVDSTVHALAYGLRPASSNRSRSRWFANTTHWRTMCLRRVTGTASQNT